MASEKERLSDLCWNSLKKIRELAYSSGLTLFLTHIIPSNVICNIAREMRGTEISSSSESTLVSYEYQGIREEFRLDEKELDRYRPLILEANYLNRIVQIISEYERYLADLVKESNRLLPQEMRQFDQRHKLQRKKTPNCYWNVKNGRGTVFLKDMFHNDLNSNYEPKLVFHYHVRNIGVHNRGLVDERFITLSKYPIINIDGNLRPGAKVVFNPQLVMQLQELIFELLLNIDQHIVDRLKLATHEEEKFWQSV